MLNPMRDKKKNGGTYRGGRLDDTCDHGLLVQKTAEGKTSYELSWKVKVVF